MKKATLLPPPLSLKGGGGGGTGPGWYKNKSCLWAWTSCDSGLHACLCACACMCTLRGWHVHYLFISPVCRAATLCISACLTIFMPHALFNTHADSDADSCRDIYVRYAHLSPGTLLWRTVAKKSSNLSSTCEFIFHLSTSGHAETFWNNQQLKFWIFWPKNTFEFQFRGSLLGCKMVEPNEGNQF